MGSRKKFGTNKSSGTGLRKFWYRKKYLNRSGKNLVPKKVSEPVSENFGTEKSLGIAIVQILGLVTHWITCCVEILGNWCGQTAHLLIKKLFYMGKKALVLKHLF